MITTMLAKTCNTCGQTKPLSEFSFRSDRPHLYRSKCKQCTRDYANKRNSDPKIRQDRISKQNDARALTRKYVYEYLSSHPCADCGADDWRVLEFDHVRGEKLFNICDMMAKDLALVVEEIKKCDSVCANCHKLRTYKRSGSWRQSYGDK